jgi:hypothetical protein
MKFKIVFWDVLPCKMIVDRRFRGTYCLHHPDDFKFSRRRVWSSELSSGMYCRLKWLSTDVSGGTYCLHHPDDFMFSRRQVWSSKLSSGMYCRVKWLSTDVSEVRTASIIIPDNYFTRQYIPEDNSELSQCIHVCVYINVFLPQRVFSVWYSTAKRWSQRIARSWRVG